MKHFFTLIVILLSFSICLQAQTIWSGTIDSDWSDTGNWLAGVVPGANDTVYIPTAPTNDPVISSGQAFTVKLVYVDTASLTINAGGSLTVNGQSETNVGIFLNGGSLTVDGSLIIEDVQNMDEVSGIYNYRPNTPMMLNGDVIIRRIESTSLQAYGIFNGGGNNPLTINADVLIEQISGSGAFGIYNYNDNLLDDNNPIQISDTVCIQDIESTGGLASGIANNCPNSPMEVSGYLKIDSIISPSTSAGISSFRDSCGLTTSGSIFIQHIESTGSNVYGIQFTQELSPLHIEATGEIRMHNMLASSRLIGILFNRAGDSLLNEGYLSLTDMMNSGFGMIGISFVNSTGALRNTFGATIEIKRLNADRNIQGLGFHGGSNNSLSNAGVITIDSLYSATNRIEGIVLTSFDQFLDNEASGQIRISRLLSGDNSVVGIGHHSGGQYFRNAGTLQIDSLNGSRVEGTVITSSAKFINESTAILQVTDLASFSCCSVVGIGHHSSDSLINRGDIMIENLSSTGVGEIDGIKTTSSCPLFLNDIDATIHISNLRLDASNGFGVRGLGLFSSSRRVSNKGDIHIDSLYSRGSNVFGIIATNIVDTLSNEGSILIENLSYAENTDFATVCGLANYSFNAPFINSGNLHIRNVSGIEDTYGAFLGGFNSPVINAAGAEWIISNIRAVNNNGDFSRFGPLGLGLMSFNFSDTFTNAGSLRISRIFSRFPSTTEFFPTGIFSKVNIRNALPTSHISIDSVNGGRDGYGLYVSGGSSNQVENIGNLSIQNVSAQMEAGTDSEVAGIFNPGFGSFDLLNRSSGRICVSNINLLGGGGLTGNAYGILDQAATQSINEGLIVIGSINAPNADMEDGMKILNPFLNAECATIDSESRITDNDDDPDTLINNGIIIDRFSDTSEIVINNGTIYNLNGGEFIVETNNGVILTSEIGTPGKASLALDGDSLCFPAKGRLTDVLDDQMPGLESYQFFFDANCSIVAGEYDTMTNTLSIDIANAGNYDSIFVFAQYPSNCPNKYFLGAAPFKIETFTGTPYYVYVLLSGPLGLGYNTELIMWDSLRTKGFIPLTSPYGTGETISDSAAVLSDKGEASVVDWVLVQLRDSNDFSSIIASRAALVQRNGLVVDTNGMAPVLFDPAVVAFGDSFYVSVNHRNHLGAMTADLYAADACDTVDFTNVNESFYKQAPMAIGFAPQDSIHSPNVFALWPGDANQDSQVDASDEEPIVRSKVVSDTDNIFMLLNYIRMGYCPEDINMDGSVIYAGQKNDIDVILDAIYRHPQNGAQGPGFVIPEQLPSP